MRDTDRVVARDIGRCLATVPGTREISYVQIAGEGLSWITQYNPNTGERMRLVTTLPKRQDYAWTAGGDLLVADGSVLFLGAGDNERT